MQEYVGEQGFGSSAVRERAAHGQKIQNELRVALAAADQIKPMDERLETPAGTFVEVELRRGTPPDVLDIRPRTSARAPPKQPRRTTARLRCTSRIMPGLSLNISSMTI
jgi:hypothetical protein